MLKIKTGKCRACVYGSAKATRGRRVCKKQSHLQSQPQPQPQSSKSSVSSPTVPRRQEGIATAASALSLTRAPSLLRPAGNHHTHGQASGRLAAHATGPRPAPPKAKAATPTAPPRMSHAPGPCRHSQYRWTRFPRLWCSTPQQAPPTILTVDLNLTMWRAGTCCPPTTSGWITGCRATQRTRCTRAGSG